MAENTTLYQIKAVVKGAEGIEKLKKSVRDLNRSSTPAARDLAKLRIAANELGRSSNRTENSIRTQISVLRDLRANVSLTGSSYKKLSRQIKEAEKSLTSFKGKGGFKAGASAAAPAALGGATAAFLPASAQFGAAAGFAKGGLAGGVAGAGIGLGVAGVAALVKQTQESAKLAAQISRLEIALKGVTKTSSEFGKAQKVVSIVSKELNVPISVATKQFTTLSASVIGAGGNVKDAEQVFRGVSEAIKATGGEAYDIQQAIRAMSQIFGKGKVSAEELQGQLGERLPGAVVKFANATNRTLPQLQKDLRDGTVGLNDVMKFVTKLSEDHRDAALKMAGSTQEAGERMRVAFESLSISWGKFFQPIGADIQNFISGMANMANSVLETANKFRAAQLEKELVKLQNELKKGFGTKETGGGIIGALPIAIDEGAKNDIKARIAEIKAELVGLGVVTEEVGKQTEKTNKAWELTGNKAKTALSGAKEAAKEYMATISDMHKMTKDAVANAFKKMEDTLVNFVMTGKMAFKDLARSILADMTRIAIRAMIIKPIMAGFGITAAKGEVFNQSGHVEKYAKGGVVTKPTMFAYGGSGRFGLMGEAGPEAIMPLKRGKGGRLGVESSGGSTNVVVNVDATGSNVEGDAEQGKMLGKMIGAAIRATLVQEQRPGGLLAA